MASILSLGLQEQQERLTWADLEPEEDMLEVQEGDEEQRGDPAHDGRSSVKGCSRSRRRRGARRKAQAEQQAREQKQVSLQLPQPELSASRSVSRSVVTWNDLLGPGAVSPSVSSETSTAASSPIPSPPPSARMSCYASAAGGRPGPLVFIPMAFTPCGGNPGGGFSHLPGSSPGVLQSGHYAPAGQPTAVETHPSWTEGHSNALRNVLLQGCPGSNTTQLQELLQQAAQAPYED